MPGSRVVMVMHQSTVAVATLMLVAMMCALEVGASQHSQNVVEWLSPTEEPGKNQKGQPTYQGTMPLGNGDVTALFWPNVTAGAFQASFSKADAMDAGTGLLKLGIMQIMVTPNPFSMGSYFNQSLDLETATVTITVGGTSYATAEFQLSAWIDANSFVTYVTFKSLGSKEFSASVEVLSVRASTPSAVTPTFFCEKVTIDPDVLVDPVPLGFPADSIIIYNRNNGSIVSSVLQQQSLGNLANVTTDWWINRQSGLAIHGGDADQFKRTGPSTLSTTTPIGNTAIELRVVAWSGQTTSASDWLEHVATAISGESTFDSARPAHTAWWADRWGRSFVRINSSMSLTSKASPVVNASLWLMADKISSDTPPGSLVSSWIDSSGNNVTIAQADSSLQPTIVMDEETNLPAVRFNGAGDYLAGNLELSDTFTAIAVLRDTGSTSVCCTGAFFTSPGFQGISTSYKGEAGEDDDDPYTGSYITSLIDYPGSEVYGTMNLFNRTAVVAVTYSTSGVTTHVDGCLDAQSGPKSLNSNTHVLIGTRNNELQRFFKGDLSELIVFDRPLSDTERESVESYLTQKWIPNTQQHITCKSPGQQISKQYDVTRYMQTIQSRTMWPIKFNGQMFVANMPPNADFRDWGPGNWWQNTRLPYGSMLANGDSDIFETILEYYHNMVPFASGRTETYFNHTGIYFTETKTIFGPYSPSDYGCSRPANFPVWLENNDYIHLDYGGDGGTPEIALFVLDHYLYTHNATTTAKYLPIATLTADFFAQHYKNRTDDGKYVIWPTQALETFWCAGWDTTNNRPPENCCVNDLPTVAGLYTLLTKLIALPEPLVTTDQKNQWTKFLDSLPPLPADDDFLRAAEVISTGKHNSETPELYGVHPYRVMTIAKNKTGTCDLTKAIKSFIVNPLAHSNSGWNQGIMNAALLGLTDVASAMLLERFSSPPAQGYRFQGFMSHYQDYEPSADHLANALTATNLMLMQPADDGYKGTMVLFPAWPCSWDVHFRLWGPLSTLVEVVYADGKLQSLSVTPESRKSDIVWANCVKP